jgi:hypothetical protein
MFHMSLPFGISESFPAAETRIGFVIVFGGLSHRASHTDG